MRKSERPYKGRANLDILFGEETGADEVRLVALSAISLPERQPRRYFDPLKLEQLAESIGTHGVLENLLVRPRGGGYELVAGERRYRAARAAGLEEVPVTVRDLTDAEALSLSLVENLQREDLNPVEETEGILLLLAERLGSPPERVTSLLYQVFNFRLGKITNNVISSSELEVVEGVFAEVGLMGIESFVSNRLPLLRLPPEILEALRQGRLEYTKAKAIARVRDGRLRGELLEEAIEAGLSLKEIRGRVKALTEAPKPSPQGEIRSLSRRLSQSKLWEKDPKKWKRVRGWLDKIEGLLEEVEPEAEGGISGKSLAPIFEEPD